MIELGERRPRTVNHEQTVHDYLWSWTVYNLKLLKTQLNVVSLLIPVVRFSIAIKHVRPA